MAATKKKFAEAWTKKTLKMRGWTETMIIDYLGAPDKVVRVKHTRFKAKRYHKKRVLEMESIPEINRLLQKNSTNKHRRQQALYQGNDTKFKNILNDILNSHFKTDDNFNSSDLFQLAIDHNRKVEEKNVADIREYHSDYQYDIPEYSELDLIFNEDLRNKLVTQFLYDYHFTYSDFLKRFYKKPNRWFLEECLRLKAIVSINKYHPEFSEQCFKDYFDTVYWARKRVFNHYKGKKTIPVHCQFTDNIYLKYPILSHNQLWNISLNYYNEVFMRHSEIKISEMDMVMNTNLRDHCMLYYLLWSQGNFHEKVHKYIVTHNSAKFEIFMIEIINEISCQYPFLSEVAYKEFYVIMSTICNKQLKEKYNVTIIN